MAHSRPRTQVCGGPGDGTFACEKPRETPPLNRRNPPGRRDINQGPGRGTSRRAFSIGRREQRPAAFARSARGIRLSAIFIWREKGSWRWHIAPEPPTNQKESSLILRSENEKLMGFGSWPWHIQLLTTAHSGPGDGTSNACCADLPSWAWHIQATVEPRGAWLRAISLGSESPTNDGTSSEKPWSIRHLEKRVFSGGREPLSIRGTISVDIGAENYFCALLLTMAHSACAPCWVTVCGWCSVSCRGGAGSWPWHIRVLVTAHSCARIPCVDGRSARDPAGKHRAGDHARRSNKVPNNWHLCRSLRREFCGGGTTYERQVGHKWHFRASSPNGCASNIQESRTSPERDILCCGSRHSCVSS